MQNSIINSALIAAASAMSFASRFNAIITPMRTMAVPEFDPASTRKKGLSIGIKGIKSTNNSHYGANLKAHFDKRRKTGKRAIVCL